MQLNPETHQARHARLHDALDELITDYFRHHPEAHLREISAQGLKDWAARQAAMPTEPQQADSQHHNGAAFDAPPVDDEQKSGA
jgi:hypothetical protein